MCTTKMNSFLHRILKKTSDEELNRFKQTETVQTIESGSIAQTRAHWIKKLGSCSASKYQVAGSSIKMSTLKTLNTSEELHNAKQSETSSKTADSPASALEMPDLESIIREFEKDYMSPSKQEETVFMGTKPQQKNFVKKIVAAFEVKCKNYNDLKTAQAAKEARGTSKIESSMLEASKRKSSIFSDSTFRSGSEEFKHLNKLGDKISPRRSPQDTSKQSDIFLTPSDYNAENSKNFRRSGVFGSPFKLFSSDDEGSTCDESKDEHDSSIYLTPSKQQEDSKHVRRSGIFSPFNRSSKDSSIKSDLYMSSVCPDQDPSSNKPFVFKLGKEDSKRRPNFLSPVRVAECSLDNTKTLDNVDLDLTLPEPEETIFLNLDSLPKTSTMIDERDKQKEEEVEAMPRVSSVADKTPKVVGAFLKKPIEVEETSIEWIPITGKKLPRKRSLKKLLTSWASKRSLDKKSKLFSSESNLNEETRELQDSGYDERSCSSSSLASLISITEVLLQQENSYIEPEKRNAFTTFRSGNSQNEDDETFDDTSRCIGQTKKKLLLTEVPRDEVKVDLGPAYPSTLKLLTMSLDRKYTGCEKSSSPLKYTLPRVPKHPYLSTIPKHPFISLTKLDHAQEQNEDVVIIKNDLYEVEFHRSNTDIRKYTSSSSLESNYDVPRRFLSKSETELTKACRRDYETAEEPVYDVPRSSHCIERPKSSLYEDAQALKRRILQTDLRPLAQFYAFPMEEIEPHYATVKPRPYRLHQDRNMLLNSFWNHPSSEHRSAF